MIVSKDEGIKIDNEKNPYLLKIKKCIKIDKENKIATFITNKDKTIDLKYKSIADPSFDTIFKKIFYDISPENNNINGKTRLISFINGILFPDAKDDDIKVREIRYIQNEIVTYGNENRKGTYMFDVPCICTCWRTEHKKENESIFGVDIEMQIKYQPEYPDRFYKYNVRLSSYHRQPFIVISLLNFKSRSAILDIYNSENEDKSNKMKGPEQDIEMKETEDSETEDSETEESNKKKRDEFRNYSDRAVGVGPSLFNGDSKPSSLLNEKLNNTVFFDLRNDQSQFLENTVLKIFKKNINNTAKAWLKLFSLRTWSKKEKGETMDRYVIPADDSYLDKEIRDAIKILELISNQELENAMIYQQDILETYEIERNEGRKEEREKLKEEREKLKEEREKIEEKARKEEREKLKEEREKIEEKARKEREKLKEEREKIEEKARKEREKIEEKARKEREKIEEKARKEREKLEEKFEEKVRKEREKLEEKFEEKARKEREKLEEKFEEKVRKEKIETALNFINLGYDIKSAKALFIGMTDNQLQSMENFIKFRNIEIKELAEILEIDEDNLNKILIKLGLHDEQDEPFSKRFKLDNFSTDK